MAAGGGGAVAPDEAAKGESGAVQPQAVATDEAAPVPEFRSSSFPKDFFRAIPSGSNSFRNHRNSGTCGTELLFST